ncbi:hypothetical protein CIB95_12360 [Lottiidibacillus patelloidae]|uniref:YCII-related domain-containing protein n=1 Tax=Lottiidibacillus patelloidae TaxID=2670334 RepID=A0A263BR80_9BACI|nr:YciI family protein [Lottiidibacillus patelloidae]OZM56213.1 hypothetical protein CIB95_12360 [Lottiidibacillus patelloidae]
MRERNQYIYQLKVIPRLQEEANWTKKDSNIVTEHFKRLQILTEEKIVILAGRTLSIGEEGFGIVIFEAESDDEAQLIMENDPAIKKGIMTAKLYPYRVALMRS